MLKQVVVIFSLFQLALAGIIFGTRGDRRKHTCH